MTWVEVFTVFVVSHLVGDYLLQTDWQARHKRGGLERGPRTRAGRCSPTSRLYTLCFLPALLVDELGVELLWVIPAIFVPHLVQDDGRLLHAYMKGVKRLDPEANLAVSIAVDQTFHLLALLILALVIGS